MRHAAARDKIHPQLPILPSAFQLLSSLNGRFLPGAFRARGHFVLAGFVFALARADLLLDLFFHQVDRGIEVAFAIFREQVRAAHSQPDGAGELPLRNPHVIVLEGHPGVHHPGIQAIQFVEFREHVLLDGVRQRYVVRGEDQLHTDNMQSTFSIFNRQFPRVKATNGHE